GRARPAGRRAARWRTSRSDSARPSGRASCSRAGTACTWARSCAPSDTPPLARPDAVVGLRADVLHPEDLEARRLQRADGRLAARAGALDEHLDLLQAVLHALARGGVGGHLGRERRRLARPLEANRTRALPHDHTAVLVGQRDERVVERRLDVRLADGDVLAGLAADAATRAASTGCRRHSILSVCYFLRCLPTVFLGPLRVRALMRVRSRVTSSSVRSRTLVSLEMPSSESTAFEVERPMPKM